jgi:hypothetical protein
MTEDAWGCFGILLLASVALVVLHTILPAEMTQRPSRDAFTIMAFITISFYILNSKLEGIDNQISYIERQIENMKDQRG